MSALIKWLIRRGYIARAVELEIRKDERERCKYLARKWMGDPDAAINVDTYIQRGRENGEVSNGTI